MEQFDIYQFILCLFVFLLLTAVFTFMVVLLVKLTLKTINGGLEDEKIKAEYLKAQAKKPNAIGKILDRVFLGVCCVALFAAFAMSLSVSFSCSGRKTTGVIPSLNVVQSGSMSYINEKHKFLQQGEVTDQLQKFDLVVIKEAPAEADLKVNDIVVYEWRGYFIIHRIVAIEEPNEKHPNERHFLLQGDANEVADSFPVRYEQIKGIYAGVRIPFIGSFVLFMKSPAGWLCVLLVVFAMIATPFAEKAIEKAKYARLVAMGLIGGNTEGVFAIVPLAQENADANEPPDEIDGALDEEAATLNEADDEDDGDELDARFARRNPPKSFAQKLEEATEHTKTAYDELCATLSRIDKVRAMRSFKGETYKQGNVRICKLAIRGKTLSSYLSLNPADYAQSKHPYEDVSDRKTYLHYPMRVKLSSVRQIEWAKELVLEVAKRNGLTVAKDPLAHAKRFASFKKSKSFVYKLRTASELLKARYKEITAFLKKLGDVRVIRGRKGITYKLGNIRICKLAIRGKTLNVYVALPPENYLESKLVFTDVSATKAFAAYPMRVKLSSPRQVELVKELLKDAALGKGVRS